MGSQLYLHCGAVRGAAPIAGRYDKTKKKGEALTKYKLEKRAK